MDNEEFIDYSLDREDFNISWVDLSEGSVTLGEKLRNLFRSLLQLPSPNIQLPFLVGFSMLPSALINSAPIGVALGQSGSGKSDLGLILARMYATTPLAATTTYAGFRNFIENHKYELPSFRQFEKNCLVVFDDIDISVLARNPELITLLKCGYNRTTAKIQLSSNKIGQNEEFDCFGPKFLTTIHPFWERAELLELKRRVILFRTQKYETYNRIDPKEVNFNGLEKEVKNFWQEKNNRTIFKEFMAQLRTNSRKELLAATATVLELEKEEVLKSWDLFFDFSSSSSVKDPLGELLEKLTKGREIVYSQEIKLVINDAKENGVIDGYRSGDIALAMNAMGWQLENANNKWFWRKEHDAQRRGRMGLADKSAVRDRSFEARG